MQTYSEHTEDTAKVSWAALGTFAANLAVCCLAVLWICWPSLERMQAGWNNLPQYSHGYLVPLFAGLILWSRRAELLDEAPAPSQWGLLLIVCGLAMKWAGTAYFYDYIDDVAVVPLLLGAFLLAGGWRAWIWSWPAVLFLLLMIPLPFRIETALQQSLLQFATSSATYVFQTLGYAAYSEGNVIHLPKTDLGVVDACSGMRMSIVCTAMAAVAAIVSIAPLPVRILVFLSGVPLAMSVNIVRICAMGIGGEMLGEDAAHQMLHDALGYLMMPLALLLLGLEFLVLNWVYDSPDEDTHRRPFFVGQPAPANQ